MGFTVEATQAAQGWSSGYGRPTTRASDGSRCAGYVSGFVHGKASHRRTPLFPAVLAGSSNFTYGQGCASTTS